MTRHDLHVLDTIETPEYMKGELSDDDLDIPPHMIPPNPDDSDILPSQVHPSYPYGNPTNIKHPAARPRPPYDPFSRALFEDMGYAGGGVNGALRWRDLALDELMPIDEQKEEAKKAMQARKMASGTANHNPQHTPPPPQQQQQQQQQQQPPIPADQTAEEGDENDGDEETEFDEEEGGEGDELSML
ncbi:hypothetical protein AMATHDRAFT_75200 [Amanita thiersii Skay4041]|uniref:Uncharacterized protein n=1 Tax=Amanita thiersii Skay4041 TaxID=703135 RepID=A0A2A9NTI9_9AGAR|nr:hypothetical protein AMATHDRAFT_75200 [Amanita thiersii Skay4041]